MSTFPRKLIKGANALLRPLKLEIQSLTAINRERERIRALQSSGHFERPVYSLPDAIRNANYLPVLEALPKYRHRFESFTRTEANDTRFSFSNPFYTSPDAEVLYTMVRERKPARIFETGCGNSTKVIRQAIIDGGLPTNLTSVDPDPRVEITPHTDRLLRQRVETLDPDFITANLSAGDFLFIDTSHEGRACNDVAFLFCSVIPNLSKGVIVHIHDIFLPWEYPENWIIEEERLQWNEQYLLHCLISTNHYRVLWPGHHLQRSIPEFTQWFPALDGRRAQSFWFLT